MSDIAIRVEKLSKRYRIGQREPYKALRDVLPQLITAPFRRLRRNPQSAIRNPQFIWALKDVSFEVKRGEVVGIIGRNGAGKTTLLKILSRITEPTEGYAEIHGRVGSLLEVGTGFHPELTGRENIYLNGAILGMKKREIDRKFDEIVAFAEVEKFIDTPVKHYSSGMYVRLAFAVAAHLEPEILLVDEVLAVGDVAFQQKCLGKMENVAREGRTVLFVSHNMGAIRNLCERTLLLDSGKIQVDGPTDDAIATYLNRNLQEEAIVAPEQLQPRIEGRIDKQNPSIRLLQIAITDQNGIPKVEFNSDEEIRVSVVYECLCMVTDLRVVVSVVNEQNEPILTSQNADCPDYPQFYRREPGIYKSVCVFPSHFFGHRRLYLTVHLVHPGVEELTVNKVLRFDVNYTPYNNINYYTYKLAPVRPRFRWSTERLRHLRFGAIRE